MLKLKLQYFDNLMRREDSLEKGPEGGKDWGQEEKRGAGDEMVNPMGMNLSKLWDIVKERVAWGAAVHGVTKIQT